MKKILFVFFFCCTFIEFYSQTIQLGTGGYQTSSTESSPVNIWYRRTVCQFVYTASEIQAQGISSPSFLTQLGFDIWEAPTYNLPGYTIKLKHTTSSNVSNNLGSSDWTEVKNAFTYAPTSVGYDMLSFDTPFYWDGVSNIGVEICWNQVSPGYNASGRLGYYYTANGYRYSWTDAAGSSCGSSPGTVTTRKPKCQMVWTVPYSTVWTGASNSDWFNSINWTAGVPINSIDAEIPGGLTKYPVINSDGAVVKNITIYSGAMLTLAGQKELIIYGDWTNNGSFVPNMGTVHFNKLWTSPNLLNGNAQDFYSIQVNNSSGITFSTGSYNIYGALIARGGTITTNNLVTLASDATKTGRIPEIKVPCTWTLNMQDSYGDGWNGGSLSIFEDGVLVGSYAASGFGSTESFDVLSGSTLTMSYTAGSWENENTYTLDDPSGNPVNSGGPNIAAGTTLYTGTSNCAITNPFAGDIIAQRYLNIATDEWRELSTPIANQTLSSWQDDGLIMAGFTGSNFPNFGWMSVYSYNETLANGIKENGWVPATNISNPLNPASTHRVYIGTGNFTMEVSGTINWGEIYSPLSYENVLASEISAAENQKGWNLIGNPYPCTIDWDHIPSGNKPNIEDAIWIWSGDLGNYGLYVGGSGGVGTNDVSNEIASSQGFWVHANTTGASITLQETDKIDSDPSFVKSFSQDDFVHIKLSSDQNNYRDEAILGFYLNSSIDYNPGLDFSKLYSHIADAPSLSFIVSDSIPLTLKRVPLDDEIILPIKTLAGISGNYSLTFSNLVSDQLGCIILEDMELNTFTPIYDSTVYTFYLSDSTLLSRFNLRIIPSPKLEVTSTTCNGNSDGLVVVTFYGSAPFQYSFDNLYQSTSNNIISINSLNSGVHNLYYTNSNLQCASGNIDVFIPEPDYLFAGVEENVPSCAGCSDGYFEVLPMGGTPPYTIYMNGTLFDSDSTLSAGNYYFNIYDSNGCSYTLTRVLGNPTTTINKEELDDLKIYPNPANESIHVESDNFNRIALYDIQGRLVLDQKIDQSCTISTQNIANGSYILSVDKNIFKRIIIQH